MDPVVIVAVAVVALVLLWAVMTFNRLVRARNRVDAAWGQVGVQLARRHDLVPNLVETVKGYAGHERTALDSVVQARSAAVSAQGPAEQARAENALSAALRGLLAITEAYPDLKASHNFALLQDELTRTEDKAAYARQFYNDAVLGYNNAAQSFPPMIVAAAAGFRPREYFRVGDDERAVPQVRF
jgi:LemA protein